MRIITAAVVLVGLATAAPAQTVTLEFVDGRVNLVARNAPTRAILAEWARLGGTTIINADQVAGPPVTLELKGVPERQALDIVLRGVAGYMAAARRTPAGPSAFDRILILPTSDAPRVAAGPTFGQPATPVMQPAPGGDGDGVPVGFGPAPVAGARPGESPEDVRRRIEEELRRRAAGARVSAQPVIVDPDALPEPEPVQTAPAAGPPPAGGRGNPFIAVPGAGRFGVVTPGETQDETRPATGPGAAQ